MRNSYNNTIVDRGNKNCNSSGTVNVNTIQAPCRVINGKIVDAKWNGNNWYFEDNK